MHEMETQIVYVRNLPRETEKDELVELFSPYGAIMQIRIGTEEETKGTAFVVYKRIESARKAIKHMNGYYMGRMYLNVSYWQPFDRLRFMIGNRNQ
jgi:pre-mRNA branch site protein p14